MDYYKDTLIEFFIKNQTPSGATAEKYLHDITAMQTNEIIRFLQEQELPEVKSINIPQFSDIDSIDGVLDIVYSTDNIKFEDIGYYFYPDSKLNAQWKYGENHYKTAALLGLTSWDKPYLVTDFGRYYMLSNKDIKKNVITKLCLRIPIIQKIIIEATQGDVKPIDVICGYLALSTAKRRHSNVHVMVDMVVDDTRGELKEELLANIRWK